MLPAVGRCSAADATQGMLTAAAFLSGNDLPGRWAAAREFVLLQTGFAQGQLFLAAWQAWRDDPQRCERLVHVAVAKHPPSRAELQAAWAHSHSADPEFTVDPDMSQALIQSWPPLTPNLHSLDFEGGLVQLLLAPGDVAGWLHVLHCQAQAICLGEEDAESASDHGLSRLLKGLARLAAPGATLVAGSSTEELRCGLVTAGFVLAEGDLRDAPNTRSASTRAVFAPRWRRRFPVQAAGSRARDAVVIGAGVAGAATAQALARHGMQVTVIDEQVEPATGASGNPAGLFHGTLNRDDGIYARLFRAAAQQAQRSYQAAFDSGAVDGQAQGLLRLDTRGGGVREMLAQLQHSGLPPDYVQALSVAQASALAGIALAQAAWFYPQGGWIAPAQWVRHVLQQSGLRFVGGKKVLSLSRQDSMWCVHGAEQETLARAPILVLANAGGVQPLLQTLGHDPRWPLSWTRGQVTHWPCDAAPTKLQTQTQTQTQTLRLPVASGSYVLPLRGASGTSLLCGATREPAAWNGRNDAVQRREDDCLNIEALEQLSGLTAPTERAAWSSRASWRLHTDDRLPIAGPVPQREPPASRRDQARWWPRESGLFVLTALGARGLSLAPLLGKLVAAQATGSPWPLEQDLVDAVDPVRWAVRRYRRGDPSQS